jgi:3-hydroxyisobutyrate dehydrogenase-like beta-hydroxyacid dehydrogenase
MANLGFLGLGLMGYPMARNLLRAGHRVALWSHTASKARQLATEENGTYCETPREVAAQADCTFLCLGDTAMVANAILGPDGVAEGAAAGTAVVDASTISPSESRRIGRELRTRGVRFLDAPCTGSTPGANGGNLTFMVGGDEAVFEELKPLFEPMGKRLFYCGEAGLGLQAKLAQNLILSNILMAFNEGMVLATKGGVDPGLMVEILEASAAKCGLISYKAPFVFRRDFAPNFSTKWMSKDVSLILDSGRELQVPLRLTALTSQLFEGALAAGLAEEDMCSTIKVLEEAAGITVGSSQKNTEFS